jgi:hypothetical protein
MAFVRRVRWLVELLRDLRHADWRDRRAVRRDLDQRLSAFGALPPEEQLGFIHPSSPNKPPDWRVDTYRATRRRRDDAS